MRIDNEETVLLALYWASLVLALLGILNVVVLHL
jgi:hypothetical protein